MGIGVFAAQHAGAAENGIGLYLLGSRGPMAGFIPPPGYYFQNDFYVFTGDLKGGRELPLNGHIVADVRSQLQADFMTGTWVTPLEVFGGNLAVGGVLPFGHVGVDAGVELTGPLGNTIRRDVRDDATLVGDPIASAAVGWHAGNWHWNVTGLLNVPIGDYRNNELANLAFHYWAADVSGALTWLDKELGVDLSTAAGFTFNAENPATDYRSGTQFHIEWAGSKYLTEAVSVGLVGYHYQQITGDTGAGATLGPFKGRVTALGGTVGWNFLVNRTPVTTRVKVFQEFNAENRMPGTSGFLTIAFPLGIGG